MTGAVYGTNRVARSLRAGALIVFLLPMAFLLTSFPPGIKRSQWVLLSVTDEGTQTTHLIADELNTCVEHRDRFAYSKYVVYSCETGCAEGKNGQVFYDLRYTP